MTRPNITDAMNLAMTQPAKSHDIVVTVVPPDGAWYKMMKMQIPTISTCNAEVKPHAAPE